jgi:tetratricopeptide (TPR) repeat protein
MLTKQQTRHGKGQSSLARRLLSPEALIVLAAVVCLIVVGPLREALSAAPVLLFLGTFALFMVPGALLTSMFLSKHFSGVAGVPAALVLSTGVFGLPGVLVMLLHRSIKEYLLICGAILVAFVVMGILWSYPRSRSRGPEAVPRSGFPLNLLWVPFAGLGAVMAYTSVVSSKSPSGDTWFYLAWVREFMSAESLGSYYPYSGTKLDSFSRLAANGWLLEQASLSRISGIDPVELVLTYLSPALVVVALLAFYALARILFENESAALLASSLAALFFLFYLDSSLQSPSGEFVGRITEDKYATRYIFLTVALGFAVVFVKDRKLRYLAAFTFICWSAVAVHPVGLMVIGISVAGFGLVHLAMNLRSRRAWTAVCGLGAAVISIALPLAAYLLATGSTYLSRPDLETPNSQASLEAALSDDRLLALGGDAYVAHPSLLLNPAILLAYLPGVPFLVWHLRRHLAAQALLGMLLFTLIFTHIPPVAAFVAKMIRPWMLERLAWPLLLAALLTIGWMVWELLEYAGSLLSKLGMPTRMAPFLPVVVVGMLAIGFAPATSAAIRASDTSGEAPQVENTRSDPVFSWMRGIVKTPSVVLAPGVENLCIPAYSTAANVIEQRGTRLSRAQIGSGQDVTEGQVPQGTLDMQRFFGAVALDGEMIEILHRYGIKYVLLPLNSPLNVQLEHLPGFRPLDNPGERYRFYEVDRTKLETTPAVEMNGHLNREEWEAVIEAQDEVLGGDEDERFLAHLAAGQAYMRLQEPEQAVQSYEQAVELFPNTPTAYSLLADAYTAMDALPQARAALEKAVAAAPRNVELHLELGALLLQMRDEQAAIDRYREVVEMFPEVPEYRVQLGRALSQAQDLEAADGQFEKAVSLDPLSADLYENVALTNLEIGRPEKAVNYLEEGLEIEPDNQELTLWLGLTYSRLSTLGGKDRRYFELAEEQLHKALELESQNRSSAQRSTAYLALSDLYLRWGREDEAADAYERAVESDFDLQPAKGKLEMLW